MNKKFISVPILPNVWTFLRFPNLFLKIPFEMVIDSFQFILSSRIPALWINNNKAKHKKTPFISEILQQEPARFNFIQEIVNGLIRELEPVENEGSLDGGKSVNSTRHYKQIQLCSDSINLIMLRPWDFLSRLIIGPTFERQIQTLKNFSSLPYGNR